MLRTCWAQPSRVIASSSQSSSLHTSAVLHAKSRQQVARAVKKANILRNQELVDEAQESRPHVVLGTRPGDDAKWENCLLAKILVNVEELGRKQKVAGRDVADPSLMIPTQQPIGTVNLPKYTSFGVGEEEKKLLFGVLPTLSSTRGGDFSQEQTVNAPSPSEAQSTKQAAASGHVSINKLEQGTTLWKTYADEENQKANAFAKLIDLRNANADGIAYENRRRIVEAFSTPENPYNPGRSEVQAALLTYKIRNLWTHLRTFKRDLGNRRGLRMLVHQRAKILRYLKQVDESRYEIVLAQLGLEPESVEGELVV